MTEPQHHATPAPAPADAPAPAPAPADASGPAARARGRKAAALVAGGVGLVLLAGAAAAASTALDRADRTAPTRYWTAEGSAPRKPEEPAPVPAGDLSGKLLPVPSAFTLGPDLAEDGNNFSVSGDKAVQGFKEARDGLSGSERKQRDEMLAGLRLKGLAGRSYTRAGGTAVYQVRLMQADPKAVGAFSEVSRKVLDLTGDDRTAPAVDGYPDAKCALVAVGEERKEKIDSMDCVAVQGDVLVNFRAFGPKPFSHADAVGFLKNQLSRLKSPGESA